MNPNLVTNIKVSKNPIKRQTTDGFRKILLGGQVGDQIKAIFDPSHIANIFRFTHMTDKKKSTMTMISNMH